MARLNIEDKFWLEVINVVVSMGSQDAAIGNAIRFFRYAQEIHKNGGLISETDFKKQGFSEALIPVFAERVEGGIRAVGADKYFGWLVDRSEAASMGGKKSAERPRDEKGRLLPNPQNSPSKTQANPSKIQVESKQAQANPSTAKQNPSESKRIQASPSSSPSSSISSSSRRETAAAFFEDGKCGAIEPFAGSKTLQAPLSKVPKELQKLWIDQWGDSRWVLKTLEKAFAKRLAAGAGGSEDWASTFTSWLWSEREKPKPQVPESNAPTYAISQEQAWDAFQSQLKTRGVESLVKLLPVSKGAH